MSELEIVATHGSDSIPGCMRWSEIPKEFAYSTTGSAGIRLRLGGWRPSDAKTQA